MASRSILDLSPKVQPICGEWLRRCSARGVAVLVYCTNRTFVEQDALYQQGRDANGKRIPGKSIVTYAKGGYSAHNYGLAWDAVPHEHFISAFNLNKLRYTISSDNISVDAITERKLDWTPHPTKAAEKEFRSTMNIGLLDYPWQIMAEEALELGVEWGGLWKSFVDYCHFQFLDGKTIADYRKNMA